MSLTLALKTPGDMLAKLHREHERIKQEVMSDDLFNVVVTGSHIKDWIERDLAVPSAAKFDVASIRSQSTHIDVCRDLANASKHFKLNYEGITADTTSRTGYGAARYGAGRYGTGEESITIVLTNGQAFDALDFAQNVVDAWEAFEDVPLVVEFRDGGPGVIVTSLRR
jgi:hypothetical protein